MTTRLYSKHQLSESSLTPPKTAGELFTVNTYTAVCGIGTKKVAYQLSLITGDMLCGHSGLFKRSNYQLYCDNTTVFSYVNHFGAMRYSLLLQL